MKRAAALIACLALMSCSERSGDRAPEDSVSEAERVERLKAAGFKPIKAGRWETKFTFTEIAVPTLGNAEKQQIMAQMAKGASGVSCLSEADAAKPGADFFGGGGSDKCVYRQFDVAGQKLDMGLRCAMEGAGSVDMELEGEIAPARFDLDSEMALRLPMVGKVRLKGTATGKHVGACTGKE